jgi:hypothetical protein
MSKTENPNELVDRLTAGFHLLAYGCCATIGGNVRSIEEHVAERK